MNELFLALDLGSTTLAGRLSDRNGTLLVEGKSVNPQREMGSDVIRRLEAARGGAGKRLQELLVGGIDSLVDDLLQQAGCPRSAIKAAAAAGNSAICHLLRQLDVDSILFPPHRPKELAGTFLDPAQLGLDLPVPLYLFPLVSGYVGGDLVAFLYGCPNPEGHTFYLDIGTNGEMALFSGGRWWVTSVAAGPTFEGGDVSCGMTARAGAVSGVRVEGDSLCLDTIAGAPPVGICGSGLVAAIAAGLEGGLIDARGLIVGPDEVTTNLSRYIAETPDGRLLRLYRDARVDLCLSQQDVRNFQLAKGAMLAGIGCLLQRAGVAGEQIDKALVTGAFGFSLPSEVLKRVALLPESMVDKVCFVPGGALEGVSRFLREPDGLTMVTALASQLKPYPLSGTPAFEQAFLQSLDF